ncbi:MAG: DUF6531 domain-containing protein [Nannocystaceae bacterium]
MGDPVDVVTGALAEVAGEFSIPGAPPIVWQRHSSTARAHLSMSLGWGQNRLDFGQVGRPRRNTETDVTLLLEHQAALDNSIRIKDTAPRRIGVDVQNGQFVVLDKHHETPTTRFFHGHVRTWDELEPGMRSVLIKSGRVTRKGKIIA